MPQRKLLEGAGVPHLAAIVAKKGWSAPRGDYCSKKGGGVPHLAATEEKGYSGKKLLERKTTLGKGCWRKKLLRQK